MMTSSIRYTSKTDTDKFLRNFLKRGNPTMSKEELAVLLYDAMRFHWPNNFDNYPRSKFFVHFQQLCKEYNVPHKFLFVTSRFGP